MFWVFAGMAVAIVMALTAGVVYVDAYTHALQVGFEQGVVGGQLQTCAQLEDQARWANNAEQARVVAGRDSAATAAAVKADTQAALHYACATGTATCNVYDPSSTTCASARQPATVPVAARSHLRSKI